MKLVGIDVAVCGLELGFLGYDATVDRREERGPNARARRAR
jgi:hypothetical protein